MKSMMENLIVALIVTLATLYACARFLPASWRRRIVHLLTRGAPGQSGLARWFNTEAGCGSGCDTCKACADPAPPKVQQPGVIKLHPRR